MKKILVVFGTRPEAIKLAPLIKLLKAERTFKIYVCATGQHKEMVNQVLEIFKISVDFNLNIMKANQDLFEITANSISKFKNVFEKVQPDLLIVQGDTTTAFSASLAAFYKKIKIAHVEAGLRSHNKYQPYPEEINRKIISLLCDFHFAPTKAAASNLCAEQIAKTKTFVTGNTVIDAVNEGKKLISKSSVQKKIQVNINKYLPPNFYEKKFILITLHRREKFGKDLETMLLTIKYLAENYDYNFVYPVHLNPKVSRPVNNILNNIKNIYLLPPLDYLSFIYLMNNSHFIITDSGGIQEESFVFKKPLIIMRDVTERSEAIKAGYAFLTGSDPQKLKKTFAKIDGELKKDFNYFHSKNPFGDGRASKRIVNILKRELK